LRTRTRPGGGWRSSARGDIRARTPRCARGVHRGTRAAAWSRAPRSPRLLPAAGFSGGQALAPLVAAALECHPPGSRAHARAEPVHASALALLRLIGPLHARLSIRPPRARSSMHRHVRAARGKLTLNWRGAHAGPPWRVSANFETCVSCACGRHLGGARRGPQNSSPIASSPLGRSRAWSIVAAPGPPRSSSNRVSRPLLGGSRKVLP
jgi:hypothetical protein